MMNIPRPEHPRPDFLRADWVNLNGEWEFHEDYSRSGRARKLYHADAALDKKITVPFCRESVLSGLGNTDFCECVWYRKSLTLPEGWNDGSDRILLHIGACDYKTEVWVNGKNVVNHVGGYVPVNADITDALEAGENIITVCADDVIRSGNQPGGKQCPEWASHGCSYTRTTGIWQTVWLERVPASYIKNFKVYTDIHAGTVTVAVSAVAAEGKNVVVKTGYEQVPTSSSCHGAPQNNHQTVAYAKDKLSPELLRGFMVAPWYMTTPQTRYALLNDVDRLYYARKAIYPETL